MAVHDYGVFNLYGNKKQNANAIKSIQGQTGGTGSWGPQNKVAYTNYANPLSNANVDSQQLTSYKHQSDNPFNTYSPISVQDNKASSVVSNIASSVSPINVSSADANANSANGLGNFGYVRGSDGTFAGLDKGAFDAVSGTQGMSTSLFAGDRDSTSYGSQYFDQNSGKVMNKNMFMPDDALKQTYTDYAAGGGKQTETEWNTSQFDKGRLDSQNFQNNMGLGMGAAQLGMSLFSTFGGNGSLAMNKKNMQVMDGQIANNNEIMATRKARAADIQKYFG